MSENKYPLFSPKLMQVGSFCYASPSYKHPFIGEWAVGAVGCEVDDMSENEQAKLTILGIMDKTSNCFLKEFNRFQLENFYNIIAESPTKIYCESNITTKVNSKDFIKYCNIDAKEVSEYIQIVGRTPTEVYYKNLVKSTKKKYTKVLYEDEYKRLIYKAENGDISIISINSKECYYVDLVPEDKIYTATIKEKYANEIKEILKYSNDNPKKLEKCRKK